MKNTCPLMNQTCKGRECMLWLDAEREGIISPNMRKLAAMQTPLDDVESPAPEDIGPAGVRMHLTKGMCSFKAMGIAGLRQVFDT